ncbi:MAG: sensor histidine kinase [Cyclobacteriaceae bacterium]
MSFSLAEQNFIIALIFASTFLLISMYHLLLTLSTKEVIYRDYFIFLMGITSYTSIYILLPIYPQFANSYSIVAAGFTTFGSLLFVKTFLDLKKSDYPNLLFTFRGMMLLVLFVMLIQSINWVLDLGHDSGLAMFMAFLALLSLILEVSVGIWLAKKVKNARLFMITSSPLFLGVFIYLSAWFYLQENSLMDQQLMWFRLILYSSLMLQMILFSTVIGKRLNNYKSEQLALEKKISSKLKVEVAEKTKEINEHRKELENINSIKNKIFALVAHDIRNPLNSLLAIVNTIENGALSGALLTEFLDDVKKRINHSVVTLGAMLQWSLNQLEGIKIKKEKVNLLVMFDSITAMLADRVSAKNIEIKHSIDDNHDILFDAEMFKVVFRNLLANAIKFSHNSGKIWVESFYDRELLHLRIKDQGIGMSKDLIDKITTHSNFESELGTEGESGTGFGLLITTDFLKMNDATLTLESIENEGTTITLAFQPVKNE